MQVDKAKFNTTLESQGKYNIIYALFEPFAEPFLEEEYFTALLYARVPAVYTKDKEDVIIMLRVNRAPTESLLDTWAKAEYENRTWQSDLDELLVQVLIVN